MHASERELVAGQPPRVEHHLVLLGLAAHGVDLDDAGHRAQLVGDHPVEQRAQLHRRVLRRLQVELVDLAEARRHRRQLGAAVAGGDVGLGQLEALGDQLAREPDVGVVVEHDGDRGDRGAADRADLGHAGQTVHRRLDGIGEVLLDLDGREPRGAGEDGDLRVGDVGHGIDGETAQREAGDDEKQQPDDHDDAATAYREFDDVLQHGYLRQLALEQECAVGDDLVTFGEPGAHLDEIARGAAGLDDAALEAVTAAHEDNQLAFDPLQAAARNGQAFGAAALGIADQPCRDVLARTQQRAPIVELDAHVGSARLFVDDRAHVADACAHRRLTARLGGQLDLLADVDAARDPFRTRRAAPTNATGRRFGKRRCRARLPVRA